MSNVNSISSTRTASTFEPQNNTLLKYMRHEAKKIERKKTYNSMADAQKSRPSCAVALAWHEPDGARRRSIHTKREE